MSDVADLIQPTRDALERGRAGFIEAGRLLCEAKSRLGERGNWLMHVDAIGINERTARRHMSMWRDSADYNRRYTKRTGVSDMPTKSRAPAPAPQATKADAIAALIIDGKATSREIKRIVGTSLDKVVIVRKALRLQGKIPDKASPKQKENRTHREISRLESVFSELHQYCGDLLRGAAISDEAKGYMTDPRSENEKFCAHSIRANLQGAQNLLARFEREIWPDGQKVRSPYLLLSNK